MQDFAILYFMEPRQVRVLIARAKVQPAGRRPHSSRGRAPLVYSAGDLIDLLAALLCYGWIFTASRKDLK